MNKKITKIGKAVAGSALLVGATLTGAAGLASAADGSQDLGDYPAPFVDDNGEVQSTIVVGESAATVDVVGAINVAGSLGNAAFSEETVTVEGGSGTWSASEGVTLSTSNQNLFLGDNINEVRETLTSNDLGALESNTFTDDAGEEYNIDYYLRVDNGGNDNTVEFGQSSYMQDEEEDPALYVPADGELFTLEAVFGTGVNFSSPDVQGEEIELFGQTYTVSTDMADSSDELVLWGSAETLNLQTGESETFEIDGEEHTLEVRYIDGTGDGSVTLRVDGNPERVDNKDTFSVDGQEVRVSGLFPEGDGEGLAQFQIGSDEIVLSDGNPIEADGETVEGTEVSLNGDGITDIGTDSIHTIEVAVGAEGEDGEDDAIRAGETFSHSFFDNIEVHFGGLNPDAADSDAATSADFSTDGEFAEVTVTDDSDNTATLQFAEDEDDSEGDESAVLQHEDGDYALYEGATLDEGDRFVANAGGFTDMYEVTDLSDEEVVLENVFTRNEVTVEDLDTGAQEKIINGQSYTFDGGSTGVTVTWSDDGNVELFPSIELENNAELTFIDSIETNVVESATGQVTVNGPAGASATVDADDSSSSDTLTVGETIYTVGVDTSGNVWVNGTASPSAVVYEGEYAEGTRHAFTVDAEGTTGESTATVDLEQSDYSGTFTLEDLESDEDVQVGYSNYGSYAEYDSGDEGEVTLNLPAAQASAGVAVTGEDGSLSASGSTGSVTSMSPTGFPNAAALDSDSNVESLKTSDELILVGGPSVNALTAELAQDNKTWSASDYSEGSAIVQLVNNAFAEGQDALVVAGYAGEDTREAANYIANYADNSEDLAGETQVELSTQQTQSAE